MIDLEAIRARDAVSEFDEEPPPEPHPFIQCFRDRRALLAAYDALREAAGKVTCRRCAPANPGVLHEFYTGEPYPCPDCADLRRLLGEGGK